jgi:hypothetical protein
MTAEAEAEEKKMKELSLFGADGVGLVGFEVKDRRGFLTRQSIKKWLDRIDKLEFLDVNAYLPSVFVCCQFDSKQFAEENRGTQLYRGTPPLVVRSQIVLKNGIEHVRYVIFVRRPKPSDISAEFDDADTGFKRLLEFNTDIMKSKNIDKADINHAHSAAQVQPQYKRSAHWPRLHRN